MLDFCVSFLSPERAMRRPLRLLCAYVALALSAACKPWPPALTGVTLVAVDTAGKPDLGRAARTRLGPPLPVIVLRPGARPEEAGLPLNEPHSGRIHITLARGTQNFCLYTTEWEPAARYILGLFLDGHARPAFAALSDGEQWQAYDRALDLEGKALLPVLATPYERGRFAVTLDAVRLPIREPAIDLSGPWLLRPDQLADLVGVFRLTVQVRP